MSSSSLFKKNIGLRKNFFVIYEILFVERPKRFAGRIMQLCFDYICLSLRVHSGEDINAFVENYLLRKEISEIFGR